MTTINSTNPLGGYATNRLDQLESQRHEDLQKAKATQKNGTDRVSISEEGRVKALALQTAQEDSGVRPDKIAALKAQISAGTYAVNTKDIASKMIHQELDLWG